MKPLRQIWASRPLRVVVIVCALLLLVGGVRVGNMVWESLYFGERGPYLQVATPRSVVVRWQTASASDGTVRYGRSPQALTESAGDGNSRTHQVTLANLAPATEYFYAIGGGEPISFVTPAPAGSSTPIRFWAIGDSGEWGKNQDAVRDGAIAWMRDHPRADRPLIDFGLALGDNAYESGTNPQFQQGYFAPYAQLLRSFVIWPVYGNHDARRFAYFNLFTLPQQGEAGGVASGSAHYYSFDNGPVHVVVLDSEASDMSPEGKMVRWLREDLKASQSPWTIAALHHPPYTHGSHNSDNASDSHGRLFQVRQNILPVLEEGGVDLVLSGHTHDFERSQLLDCHYGTSDTLKPEMVLERGALFHKPSLAKAAHEGAVFVVAGSSSRLGNASLDHPAMAFSAAQLGSLVVDVEGAKMDAHFIDATGAVRDSFTLVKGAGETYRHRSLCQ